MRRAERAYASSPHARGSSLTWGCGETGSVVVPARAGIFPCPPQLSRRRCCRPRTRGDLPLGDSYAGKANGSSPHARGSSHVRRLAREHGVVVPARAGIFPWSVRGRRSARRRPRTRGDLPTSSAAARRSAGSSPHARGSSVVEAVHGRRQRVVPARAGIFLSGTRVRPGHGCRPRTRGDLPITVSVPVLVAGSSPHARGSSLHRDATLHGEFVVPARAGIFP